MRRPLRLRAAASRSRPRSARPAGRRAEWRRHSSAVAGSSVELESRGELDRAQHAQAVVAERRGIDGPEQRAARGRRGRRTDRRSSSVSGSQAIALTVKSRRRAASSSDRSGSPVDLEALVSAADLRFAAGQRDVDVADLVDGEALADGVHRPEASRAARAAGPAGSP